MTDTLDLPQHRFVCGGCGRARSFTALDALEAKLGVLVEQNPSGPCNCGADPLNVRIAPTLTFADFESYMLSIWDRLEAHTDTSETNREAIDAAIRAVGRSHDER